MDAVITKKLGKVFDQQSEIREAPEISEMTDTGSLIVHIELAHDDDESLRRQMMTSTLEGLARWEAKRGLTPPER